MLSDYDQIFRQDLKMWLLVSADYAGFTESAFRWNEWELQSLEGAGQDQAWRQEIIAFWDHHLPIALSVEDGYSYYALRSDGAVVAGREPEYEETMPAAESCLEFLQRLKQGDLPQPWPSGAPGIQFDAGVWIMTLPRTLLNNSCLLR